MDFTQILNNIVLGLSRLGDVVKGWDNILNTLFLFKDTAAWGSGLAETVFTAK
ncbi:hypothetical protein NQ015_05695 [Corynebacterium sp. 153RC1]|uniref:hypothetical protein n=1 Tax=unclassified Corynebacterium TaxID=2624378 RepID=UPI00211BD0EC|nr:MULTISPECIES: hypothetical protein [unclassified Corynebacterium]MCQ9352499.1 hypothetical protein [Corynebacterium sp. 209RC1]MCQ9354683.1 hypothetical protein [Corynebacterium sp. 1222RC1]MCQ9356794.1 hypothetical protein [Corynebacterium sp. 122RC1]MCQ9359002.1 hypothetical protein [Corynebacterium sp. 142RC1]MCQ9361262.1 hypothetical protein [Corynebacterium sp. 153RC1]